MAVSRLSPETQQEWHALAAKALKSELDTFWMEELIDQAIDGKLEQRIVEDFSMSDEDFTGYLNNLCERDIKAAAQQEDIRLDGLSTADAEWIQAAQAPPELYEQGCAAPEEERPLLLAGWIEAGKVPCIKFAPGSEPGSDTPGSPWQVAQRS